jgi:hypothetical protein
MLSANSTVRLQYRHLLASLKLLEVRTSVTAIPAPAGKRLLGLQCGCVCRGLPALERAPWRRGLLLVFCLEQGRDEQLRVGGPRSVQVSPCPLPNQLGRRARSACSTVPRGPANCCRIHCAPALTTSRLRSCSPGWIQPQTITGQAMPSHPRHGRVAGPGAT